MPITTINRVLLVEDNPRDAEMALDAFAQNHLSNEVLHVRDGAEALNYLYRRGAFAGRTDGHPAVILLDLNMPRVDGLEALRQIKDDPALKTIPVVIMTSSRTQADLGQCHALGVNAYLVKPVKFLEFVAAVKLLGGSWALLAAPPPPNTQPWPTKTADL